MTTPIHRVRAQGIRSQARAWARRTTLAGMAASCLLFWNTTAQAQPAQTPPAPAAQPLQRADPADIAALIESENWPARLALLRRATERQLEVAMTSPTWSVLSAEQKTALLAELQAFMAERFAWPGDMQPMIQQAYQEDASQSDVRTLLDFYGSPDGQWLVRHFQNAFDNTEQKLQLDARTLITAWSTELSSTPNPSPYEPKAPTPWQPQGTHATQCAHALNTLVKAGWSRQLVGIKVASIDRFARLVSTQPDAQVRQLAFQDRLRNEITYEAFEPALMADLCAALSEADIARGLAIEQSAARQGTKTIEARLGQGFGRRMQTWQQQTLMPGIGQRMQAARQAAASPPATR